MQQFREHVVPKCKKLAMLLPPPVSKSPTGESSRPVLSENMSCSLGTLRDALRLLFGRVQDNFPDGFPDKKVENVEQNADAKQVLH